MGKVNILRCLLWPWIFMQRRCEAEPMKIFSRSKMAKDFNTHWNSDFLKLSCGINFANLECCLVFSVSRVRLKILYVLLKARHLKWTTLLINPIVTSLLCSRGGICSTIISFHLYFESPTIIRYVWGKLSSWLSYLKISYIQVQRAYVVGWLKKISSTTNIKLFFTIMLGKVKSVIPLGQKEKKTIFLLKGQNYQELGGVKTWFMGAKRTHSVKISMVPEVFTVGYWTQLFGRRDSQAFAFPNHWQ